jgi:hypothetical protein
MGVYKYVLGVHFGRRFDWGSMILCTFDCLILYAFDEELIFLDPG